MSANIKLWVHLIYGNRFYFRLAGSLLIFSHRCMVTQCAQLLLKVDNKDEEIKQNKTTARKIGLREEKRKPMRDEEIFANYFRALPRGSMTITMVLLKGSNIIFGNFPIVFVIF